MNVTQFFKKVAHSPLADTFMANGGDALIAEIPVEYESRVVNATNLALVALFSRLSLRTRTINLRTVDGLFTYPLRKDFALTSGSSEPNKFIEDSPDSPFLGDVLQIEYVMDSQRNDLGLNDRRNATSWFTTEPDVLTMDYPVTGDLYFVQYRAAHPEVVEGEDYDSQFINVPPALVNTLVTKTILELYTTMGTETAIMKAQELETKYAALINEHEMLNTFNTSVVDTREDTFQRGGWV